MALTTLHTWVTLVKTLRMYFGPCAQYWVCQRVHPRWTGTRFLLRKTNVRHILSCCRIVFFASFYVGRSSAEAAAQIADIVAIAHDAGASVEVIISTSWDCPFDGPTPPQRVLDIVDTACDFGADRIAIADTIGTATPGRVTQLVELVYPRVGARPLGAHFHNTRGSGLASAWAAVSAGVTRLDASVGGLGGCPFAPGASGNIATEDLVYLLTDSGVGVDVDLTAAIEAARVARSVVGHDLPSALLRAGDRMRA